jgi:hypothetical protein
MKYQTELIALLESSEAIKKVWVNKDASIWHLVETPNFKEIDRETILKQSK